MGCNFAIKTLLMDEVRTISPDIVGYTISEAGILPPKVETSIRESIGETVDTLLSEFKGSTPRTLATREELIKGIDQRLVFVDEEDIPTIASAFFDTNPDDNKASAFFKIDGEGPIAVGVPSKEKAQKIYNNLDDESKKQVNTFILGSNFSRVEGVRYLILAQNLTHELVHVLQNFKEVNVNKPEELAFVETAVRYYTMRIFEKNNIPYITNKVDLTAFKEYSSILREFDEQTLKDILLGNKPKISHSTSFFSPGAERFANYTRVKIRLLSSFVPNRIKYIFDNGLNPNLTTQIPNF